MERKRTLIGLTLEEMRTVAEGLGLPRYAAGQLMQWVYTKRATQIDQMTNLSKAAREKLAQDYTVGRMEPVAEQRSSDGTIKYLFPTVAGGRVETVYIPDGDRATLCISCQVGCKMGCRFCMTARQGFHGHLTAGDILNQILSQPNFESLTNIVFMGQGEPLDNLDNVLRAAHLLTAPEGLAWSPRRITISTVGLPHGLLDRLCTETECHLAISLHHPLHEGREAIIPAEKAMPVQSIIETLQQYDWAHQRRLTFEYIVFHGLNHSTTHRRALVQLLQKLPCRVNLIRFHNIPDTPLQGADEQTIEALRDYLNHHGITATIRASRGQDIMAACGLLNTSLTDKH